MGRGLHIAYTNIRSVNKNLELIQATFEYYYFSVISMSETWLNNVNHSMIVLGMYLNNNCQHLETQWITLTQNGGKEKLIFVFCLFVLEDTIWPLASFRCPLVIYIFDTTESYVRVRDSTTIYITYVQYRVYINIFS